MGFATRNAIIGKLHRLGIVSKKPISLTHTNGKVRHRATGSQIKPVNVNPQKVHAHYTRKHRLRLEFPIPHLSPPLTLQQPLTMKQFLKAAPDTATTQRPYMQMAGRFANRIEFLFLWCLHQQCLLPPPHHPFGAHMVGKRHGHTSRQRVSAHKWKVRRSPTYMSWEAMNSQCLSGHPQMVQALWWPWH